MKSGDGNTEKSGTGHEAIANRQTGKNRKDEGNRMKGEGNRQKARDKTDYSPRSGILETTKLWGMGLFLA